MLFIMRGTSCSGKDTFIEKHFEPADSSPHVISSDRIRSMLYGSPTVQRHNKQVFELIHKIIEERISSKVTWTVYNATNLKMSDCNKIIDICKKYKTPYTFISIRPPALELLFERSIMRGERGGLYVPQAVLERHIDTYHNNFKYFVEEAVNSRLCSLIEIDQNYEVLNHVD